jgi:hypothetical protein
MVRRAMPWPLGNAEARVPLTMKVAYTLFLLVMVPHYLHQYGPLNFLWFCDVALMATCIGLWIESSLLLSMQAVGILLPQTLWAIDLLVRLIGGKDENSAGIHFPVDLTEYMFDEQIAPFTRGLSLFHGWLPILLLWLVWRLGYERRALVGQVILGCTVLLVSFLLVTEYDPAKAGNVNKVFGFTDGVPQTEMLPLLWVGRLMLIATVCVYLPTHLLLLWLMPPAPSRRLNDGD